MICFALRCPAGHEFEGWFPDNARFERQAREQLLSCPICGDTQIEKAIMAPAVHSGRSMPSTEPAPCGKPEEPSGTDDQVPAVKEKTEPAPAMADAQKAMVAYAMMRRIQTYVERNFDNVGRKFPEEVRKIHQGEVDARNIYGEATPDEAKELRDEGIEVQALPVLPKLDS